MEFTAVNVEIVVTEFYRSGSYHQHNDWLTRCQVCPEAWSFGWELINPTKNPEVQFFGANTIATKVSKCLHEIPEAQIPELQQKLLSMLSLYAQQGPKIVLTRLCVGVASLVNQTLPNLWPQPIANLITMFQAEMESKGLAYLNVLLELLTIIPEEFATASMLQPRRGVVRTHLSADLNLVLDLLNKVFGQANTESETMLHSIKCLQSWVQFGVPNENIEALFDRLMATLHDEELFDSSLDAMCSIVSHPNTHKYPNTMKRILSRILRLTQLLHKYIAEESFEMAMPLATLFITYGESHSRMLLDWTVESQEGAAIVLELITTIFAVSSCHAQYPLNETISEMPFGFWYIFQVI